MMLVQLTTRAQPDTGLTKCAFERNWMKLIVWGEGETAVMAATGQESGTLTSRTMKSYMLSVFTVS